MPDAPVKASELRNGFDIAWMVAKRRLLHPETADMVMPCDNIVATIELIVNALFDAAGDAEVDARW